MANPFPAIRPLDLPNAIQPNPIDFRPLGQIGDTIAAARRKQQIADVLKGATDASGNINVEKAGTLLAQIGEDPKAFLALAQQKAALAQSAGQHAQDVGLRQQALDLQREQFQATLEGAKVPPGFTRTPEGGITFVPGGPADPSYVQQVTTAKIPEGALFTDAELKPLAEQARAGDTSVFTNIGRGTQGAENLVRLRREIARQNAQAGISGAEQAAKNAEFFGEKAGQRTLGTRTANIELPAAEFQQMAPLALEASAKVNRTQYPTINSAILAVERGTGDENVVKFAVAANTLANIYARAVSPTGVPTDELRKKGLSLLEPAFANGQFGAAVGMMQQEIAAARASPGSVRQQMRENFVGGATGQPQGLGGPGALKQFKSPTDVQIAVQRGILKSGDTFLDSNGTRRVVP